MNVFLCVVIVLASISSKTWAIDAPKPFPLNRIDNRILDGQSARPGQMPWQIYMIFFSSRAPSNRYLCGGSLISTKHALTAAHCCMGFDTFLLGIGTIKLNLTSFTRTSRVCKYHGGYNASTLQNDIAVVSFRPIKITRLASPIRLPFPPGRASLFIKANVNTSGWGVELTGRTASTLKYMKAVAISNIFCKTFFGDFIVPTMICAKGTGVKSTCFGDSGGPLVTRYKGTPIIIGITSFVSGAGCGASMPFGFTRVTEYGPWIKKVMRTI